jgi:hypothetical protein
MDMLSRVGLRVENSLKWTLMPVPLHRGQYLELKLVPVPLSGALKLIAVPCHIIHMGPAHPPDESW